MVRPPQGGGGIPPQPARAGPHFHCATGFQKSPLTRARVRLLGPCFKTGRMGSRHRRRPLAPWRERTPPGNATRSSRTEDSPAQSTVAPGAGGPVLPRRVAGTAAVISLGPGKRRFAAGGCNTRRRSGEPPSTPGRFKPNQSRSRRTTAEEMRPTGDEPDREAVPQGDPPDPGRPTFNPPS